MNSRKAWDGARSRVLSGALELDIVENISRVKSSDVTDLLLFGSSTLTSTLLEHGLVEEVVLLVGPVLLATGEPIFAKGTPARAFELTGTTATSTGIVVNSYKPVGPLKNQP